MLKINIIELEEKVGLLKRAVGNASDSKDGPLKVKVSEPKAYSITQNARELENFL